MKKITKTKEPKAVSKSSIKHVKKVMKNNGVEKGKSNASFLIKNYVIGAISLAVIGVIALFFGAFYLISIRLNYYGLAKLPETGEELVYYTQCILTHRNSEIVTCQYNVNVSSSEYRYEDEEKYYSCKANRSLVANVCDGEIKK